MVVEGTRPAVEKQVSDFVSNLVHQPYGDTSLVRWRSPVCPLVAGLPREHGEFVLQTISQVARDAGVSLGAQDCKRANFFVVVTNDPHELLVRWRKKSPELLNGDGPSAMRRFEDQPGPVRVLYNASVTCADTGQKTSTPGSRLGVGDLVSSANCNSVTSRLKWASLNVFDSVIVLIDASEIEGVQWGQLANYVAMVGMAKLDLDRPLGDAPTILRLFASAERDAAPAGLSTWDRAFLKALYRTSQHATLQRWLIVDQMVDQLLP